MIQVTKTGLIGDAMNWWFFSSMVIQLLIVVGGVVVLLTMISIAKSLKIIAENAGDKHYQRGTGVLDQDGYEPNVQASSQNPEE